MSVLELLSQQLGGNAVQQISRQVGANEQATSQAVSAALPLLVTALANNTRQESGAASLLGALDRDHDGSVLDDVAGFLGGGGGQGGGGGAAILGHILGSRQGGAEQAIGAASGLNRGQVGQILAMLAPLVMGALGKQKRSSGLDMGGLSDLLQGERRQVKRAQPEGMDIFGKLLDADGDGEIGDDIAKMGMGMLGKMFGGR